MLSVLQNPTRFSFLPYITKFHGFKYTKNNYYRYQLTRYLTLHPDASYQDAKHILQQGIDEYIEKIKSDAALRWSDSSLKTICSQIRREIKTGNALTAPQRKPFGLTATGSTHRDEPPYCKAATTLQLVFEDLSIEESVRVLDEYSKNEILPWGQSIEAAKQLRWTVLRLNKNYRYKIIQRQKQPIYCAVTILDRDGTVKNKSFLRKLGDQRLDLQAVQSLGNLRWDFDNDDSLHLYDKKYDGKYRTFGLWPFAIKISMSNFWSSETIPSPQMRDTLILDHSITDDNGKVWIIIIYIFRSERLQITTI